MLLRSGVLAVILVALDEDAKLLSSDNILALTLGGELLVEETLRLGGNSEPNVFRLRLGDAPTSIGSVIGRLYILIK